MPVHVAESPLTCVAVGSGRSLEEFEAIHRSARARSKAATEDGASKARGAGPVELFGSTLLVPGFACRCATPPAPCARSLAYT